MSKLGLGISVIVAIGFGWFGYQSYSNYQTQLDNIKQAKVSIQTTKLAYQKEKTKHPTIKNVESNYQKALDTSKQFLALENKFHDAYAKKTDIINPMVSQYFNSLTSLASTPSQVRQPFVPLLVNDWRGSVEYGGQTNTNKISMAFKYYKQGKLMMVVAFFYHIDTVKLSGFQSYQTKVGLIEAQKTFSKGQGDINANKK